MIEGVLPVTLNLQRLPLTLIFQHLPLTLIFQHLPLTPTLSPPSGERGEVSREAMALRVI